MIQEILEQINMHPFITAAIVAGIIIFIHKYLHRIYGAYKNRKANGKPAKAEKPAKDTEESALEGLQKRFGKPKEREGDIVDVSHEQVSELNANIKELMGAYHDQLEKSKQVIEKEELNIQKKAETMIARKNKLSKTREELDKNLNLTKTR